MPILIKNWEKLYKITKNGKEIMWWVYLRQHDSDKIDIVVERGYTDEGSSVRTEVLDTLTKGKAGRSVLEQAILEANAKYREKYRANYRSKSSSGEKAEKINIKPYLLQNFNEHHHKIHYPARIQPKLDGVRALFGPHRRDSKLKLEFTSRRSREFPNPLNHIKREAIDKNVFPHTRFFLDGEIYEHGVRLHEINGIVQKQTLTPEYKEKSKGLKFHVFDYLDLKNPNETYEVRRKKLTDLIKSKGLKTIVLVDEDTVTSEHEARAKADEYIADGYEGAVIRNLGFRYRQTRISDAQKIKKKMSDEFDIIDITNGKGRFKDAAIFVLKTPTGDVFRAIFKGTQQEREEFFTNRDQYIGKQATVEFQELTEVNKPDGTVRRVPRDPRVVTIREDI